MLILELYIYLLSQLNTNFYIYTLIYNEAKVKGNPLLEGLIRNQVYHTLQYISHKLSLVYYGSIA